MMENAQDLPELVAAAQANAKPIQERIANGGSGEDIAALVSVAVDIFAVFEARMQHHFKRGPFSRKLNALLLETGEADLADRVHQYYLAINVLKHGKGASYRELLKIANPRVVGSQSDAADAYLVDVAAPGFFDGLVATILEARTFLENR